MSLALALAPSGTFTYAGFNERVTWSTGAQGWATSTGNTWINFTQDFAPVITAAIARVVATSYDVDTIAEPRFWIKRAYCKTTITNCSQVDCDVTCYPWVVRRDTTQAEDLYNPIKITALENVAGSTSSAVTPTTVGFTPFQSRWLCESVKIGKPKKVHLQGGQSYTFSIRDNRMLYVNQAMIGFDGEYPYSIHGRSRGMMFSFRGIPVNDTVTATSIQYAPGACDLQSVITYEWVSPAMPIHFNDVIPNNDAVTAFHIIQPQTGAVTNTPAVV